MIYRLRRKFIKICVLSFVAVFIILIASISMVTSLQTNKSLDTLADIVSENNGRFPNIGEFLTDRNQPMIPEGINHESPFTTRFFTVYFNESGQLLHSDIRSIASVSKKEAIDYAEKAVRGTKERGWADDFRYKVYDTVDGKAVVFINGIDAKEANQRFMLSVSLVFAASSIVIIFLVILISQYAVKPAAESYEKQKQFITDANHELKTPLTLIRTNLDIMESEIGPNEWLNDIREEAETMTGLVNRLVTLARMDEEETQMDKTLFNLSDAVMETASVFSSHIEKEQKILKLHIPEGIEYTGNEGAIRQLVSILMDNAVKYCDNRGTISVSLQNGRHPILFVDNSYQHVDTIALDRLFDRFYRADKARTYGSGFGIGLSVAKAIVQKHRGEIRAQNIGNHTIRFQVSL